MIKGNTTINIASRSITTNVLERNSNIIVLHPMEVTTEINTEVTVEATAEVIQDSTFKAILERIINEIKADPRLQAIKDAVS